MMKISIILLIVVCLEKYTVRMDGVLRYYYVKSVLTSPFILTIFVILPPSFPIFFNQNLVMLNVTDLRGVGI